MEIQTAIITGLFTIFASILTVVLKEYFDTRKLTYEKVEKRIKEIVTGRWKGSFEQIYNNQLTKFEVSLELKVDYNGKISGKAQIPWVNNSLIEVVLKGGFYSQRFLQMDYENIDKAIMQFGSYILKLSDNAEKLEGNFVGYSQHTGKIINGSANYDKNYSL
ncbi:MAG: hypothetical protein ACRCVT_07415 [Leadbetterella sp.]